jgi:hypothetical protein
VSTSLPLLALAILTKARRIGLVVDERLDAFLAAIIVEAVGGLLRADRGVFCIVTGHFADAPDGNLEGIMERFSAKTGASPSTGAANPIRGKVRIPDSKRTKGTGNR